MGLFWYSCIIQSITLIYQQTELLLRLCASVSYITVCSYMHTGPAGTARCKDGSWSDALQCVKSGLAEFGGRFVEETASQQLEFLRLWSPLTFGSHSFEYPSEPMSSDIWASYDNPRKCAHTQQQVLGSSPPSFFWKHCGVSTGGILKC